MRSVLLVEDAPSSQLVVRRALDQEYRLVIAETESEAREQIKSGGPFDLILLDLYLPDGKGLNLLAEWQAHSQLRKTPILLLTCKEDLPTKLSAFALGAQDYLVKPIHPNELKARVQSHLRQTEMEQLKLGRMTLNLPLAKVIVMDSRGQETLVHLTSKEFRVLAWLATHPGRVVTRAEIIREIWGNNKKIIDRTVDSHICGLRRKLGDVSEYVQSVAGRGYRFHVKA